MSQRSLEIRDKCHCFLCCHQANYQYGWTNLLTATHWNNQVKHTTASEWHKVREHFCFQISRKRSCSFRGCSTVTAPGSANWMWHRTKEKWKPAFLFGLQHRDEVWLVSCLVLSSSNRLRQGEHAERIWEISCEDLRTTSCSGPHFASACIEGLLQFSHKCSSVFLWGQNLLFKKTYSRFKEMY